jgi:hypothetical protein
MPRISFVVFLAATGILAATLSFRKAGFGQASPPAQPSYRFSSRNSSLNIPIELVANGLVFLRAKVNDHFGWFILDNASQGFTVDRDYARRISLSSSGSAAARGGGANAIEAQVIRDVQISLPGFELTHRNLIGIDLKALEPALGHEVDGIIGSRLFDDFVVVVDYEQRRMSVYLPKEYKPSPQETSFAVQVDEHGFPFIEATIALPGLDPVSGSFLIDGGANTYADIYKPFADAHHIPPATMKLLDEPGTSTGGTTESRDGRAERIEVGPYTIQNPPITFAQDTEGLMASKDYSGLIGAEFLERFTVVFDNPRRRIYLTPNSNYAKPAEYDESGLRIRAEQSGFHKFVVRRIVPHSPAVDAGIAAGDMIEWIDSSSTEKMTLTELRSMLCRPNAVYSVGILRSGRRLRVTLPLRPLI